MAHDPEDDVVEYRPLIDDFNNQNPTREDTVTVTRAALDRLIATAEIAAVALRRSDPQDRDICIELLERALKPFGGFTVTTSAISHPVGLDALVDRSTRTPPQS